MTVLEVPSQFCVNCVKHNTTKRTHTCTKDAVLTQNPVTGEPEWCNLKVCDAVRVGSNAARCTWYQAKP